MYCSTYNLPAQQLLYKINIIVQFFRSCANESGAVRTHQSMSELKDSRRTKVSHAKMGLSDEQFSLLLARFRSYAISYASFASSSAGFYQIRTWMLWKLPGTRLFRVGWKKHLACLCFSTLNKKIEVKFERISLPERGIEPGTPSLWVRCATHYTVWTCYETKKSWSLYITFRFLQYMQ